MDRLDHASIVDGCLLSGARWKTQRHDDMGHLEKLLRQARGQHGSILVKAGLAMAGTGAGAPGDRSDAQILNNGRPLPG
jgi:7-keto-8-aminopelargonate synthetase-like enzyme